MPTGTSLGIATLNARGMRQAGKREKFESWMKAKNIHILALQETHISQNSKESRNECTWFFSGEERVSAGQFAAGVGF
eukprot:1940222-Pyramimonas_sp.AAC.1